MKSNDAALLSPAEFDVFKLMIKGHSGKEMADQLCVCEKTVKFHLTHIYAKMNGRRGELIAKYAKEEVEYLRRFMKDNRWSKSQNRPQPTIPKWAPPTMLGALPTGNGQEIASVTTEGGPIQNIERRNDSTTRRDGSPNENNSARKPESTMQETKMLETNTFTSGQKGTKTNETLTTVTQGTGAPTLKQGQLVETLDVVGSESMSVIDESAKHLLNSMKALTTNLPDSSARLYEPERVTAMCMCADQIQKLIRLKLDIRKANR